MKILKIKIILLLVILVPLILLYDDAQDNNSSDNDKNIKSKSNRIAVVINNYLSNEVTESLNTYFEDLRNEGYEPILKEWSLEKDPEPTKLKGYLKSLYENGGLQGAVFIGDLPVAMYEDKTDLSLKGPFPTDHYYMDLESDEWKDTDGDGLMDRPVFTEKSISKRAIWMSRLKASGLEIKKKNSEKSWEESLIERIYGKENDEVKRIKDYFNKNHAFRTGTQLYTERLWTYLSTEDVDQMQRSMWMSLYYTTYNKNTDFFLGDLSKDLFLKLLTEGSNEIGLWICHGKTNSILINGYNERIYSDELNSIKIETAFILPVSCWIGSYTASNYFAGSLLFSGASGVQTLIAATQPIRLWGCDLVLRAFQEGKNLGESYLSYLSNETTWYQELLSEEKSRVILGDGTLKQQRNFTNSEKIVTGKDVLRSAELRKEITPSFILPVINTLRFYYEKDSIFWNEYYHNSEIIYRLEKEGLGNNKILVYEGHDNEKIVDHINKNNNYYLTYIWDDAKSKSCIIIPKDAINILKTAFKYRPNLEAYILDAISNKEKAVYLENELSIAITNHDINKVDELLKAGANPNAEINGLSFLTIAITLNYPEIVALLIIHGADINTPDEDGVLPLDLAIDKGNLKIIELLKEAGARAIRAP